MNEAAANRVGIPQLADAFDLSRPIHIMACAKTVMDRIRPGRCAVDCPPADLIAFDGTIALSLRRSRGLRDEVSINRFEKLAEREVSRLQVEVRSAPLLAASLRRASRLHERGRG